MPIVSLAEVKTYLGLTGTQDDQLIAKCIVTAEGRISRDTGRTFAYSSNVTRTYSTDGQASVVIHDVPAYASNSRTVRLDGVLHTEGADAWFLPDRRNPEVSVTLQLRHYDTSRGDWYKASPNWFDGNMDSPRYAYASGNPNDLVYNGPEGHANPQGEVVGIHLAMTALEYYRAKSGAAGTITTPTGELIQLGSDPVGYEQFVKDWKIHTWVSSVG